MAMLPWFDLAAASTEKMQVTVSVERNECELL